MKNGVFLDVTPCTMLEV